MRQKVFFCFLFFLGILAGYLSVAFLERERIDLNVDALISGGDIFEVYINKKWTLPRKEVIYPEVRHTYVFENVPHNITSLRLDPTNISNGKIIIYHLKFQKNGEIIREISPHDLASWEILNAVQKDVKEESVEIIAQTNDPILQKDINIKTSSLFFNSVKEYLKDNTRAVLLAGLFAIFFVLFVSFRKKRYAILEFFYYILVIFGVFFVTKLFYIFGIFLGGNIPEVYNVVGHASYTGLVKEAEIRAFWFSVLSGGLFVFLFALLHNSLKKYFTHSPRIVREVDSKKNTYSLWIVFGAIASFAFFTFPNLSDIFTNFRGIHLSDFDSQNIVTWEYFKHIKLIPLRDFWYIYNGFYYFSSYFPPGISLQWLHNVLVFSICAISIHGLLNYSKVRSLLFLLSSFLIFLVNPVSFRFLLPVSAVLFFALTLKMCRRDIFIILGIYYFYIFFLEPTQFFYVAPACVVLFARDISGKRSDERLKLVKNSIVCFGIASVLILAYISYLNKIGALFEYVNLYRSLRDLATYVSISVPVLDWAYRGYGIQINGVFWWANLILFLLSIWNIAIKRERAELQDYTPFALALVSCMISQKSMLRPMYGEALVVPIIGLLLLFFQSNFIALFKKEKTKSLSIFIIGIIAGVFTIINDIPNVISQKIIEKKTNLFKDISLIVARDDKWGKIKESYFSPESFRIDGMSGSEIKKSFLKKMSLDKKDDLFILGDDSYLYIIMGQQAPFYITFYNQSILYSQKNTVSWIDIHKPKYVLWRDTFKDFDGVPNYTRVPLVFEKVIQDYKFKDTYESFLILERKSKEERIDLDFWKKHLSDTIQLGFIPSRSEPERSLSKNTSTSFMATYLIVDIEKPSDGREREIVFNIHNDSYKIKFRERRGITTYHILLDRIWFWNVVKKNEIEAHLVANDGEGMKVKTSNLNLSKEILY